MFDVPPADISRREWRGDIPIEADDWHVGLIVGPSGSGKTQIGKRVFGADFHPDMTWGAASVIDCNADRKEISAAIERACSGEFKDQIQEMDYPFGEAGASIRIMHILKQANLSDASMKFFYDLPELQIAG